MGRLSLLLLLTGCHELFSIESLSDAGRADGDAATDALDTCPSDYVMHQGGRYRVITGNASLQAQFADCEDDLPGATHLVVFDSLVERFTVYELATAAGLDYWYVGAFQPADAAAAGDDWIWVTGDAVLMDMWHSGEPNDADNAENQHEQCAAQNSNRAALSDEPCGRLEGSVCECDGRGSTALATEIVSGL